MQNQVDSLPADSSITADHEAERRWPPADYIQMILRMVRVCLNRADGGVRVFQTWTGFGLRADGGIWLDANIMTSEVIAALKQIHPATGRAVGGVAFDEYTGKSLTVKTLEPWDLFNPPIKYAAKYGLDLAIGECGIPWIYDGHPGNLTPVALAAWWTDCFTFLKDPAGYPLHGVPDGKSPSFVLYWDSDNAIVDPANPNYYVLDGRIPEVRDVWKDAIAGNRS